MTKYYLKFGTMKHIMQTPVNCSLEDALHVICRAEEIACMCILLPVVNGTDICKLNWRNDNLSTEK